MRNNLLYFKNTLEFIYSLFEVCQNINDLYWEIYNELLKQLRLDFNKYNPNMLKHTNIFNILTKPLSELSLSDLFFIEEKLLAIYNRPSE